MSTRSSLTASRHYVGTVPWHKPWNAEAGLPKNLVSGKAYRGINVFLLGTQHYTSPYWLTFHQCKERGAVIRKGEKATTVVFWKVSQYTTGGYRHGRRRGPQRSLFTVAEAYYSALFHELTHSTGHAKRLNRPTLTDLCPFSSTNYSKEALCAEMSAAYLGGLTGITNHTIDNSAAYIQGWLAKLKRDPQVLIHAAAQAQKAADYITHTT